MKFLANLTRFFSYLITYFISIHSTIHLPIYKKNMNFYLTSHTKQTAKMIHMEKNTVPTNPASGINLKLIKSRYQSPL